MTFSFFTNKNPRNNSTRRANRRANVDYQTLEPRQLLAIEVGLNFTASIEGADSALSPPNAMGDVSSAHIVEFIEGRFSAYNKADGAEVANSTSAAFWTAAGATVVNNATQGQMMFDEGAQVWFASAVDIATREVFIAVSNNADPTAGWQSVSFDATAAGAGRQVIETHSLSINNDAVHITVKADGDFLSPTTVYSIRKAALTAPAPSNSGMTSFRLTPANINDAQVVQDESGVSRDAIVVATVGEGNQLITFRIKDPGTAIASISAPNIEAVPYYEQAPGGRQPGGTMIDNGDTRFTGNIQYVAGNIWAVHGVKGNTGSAAIRWYKIDAATGSVVNTGLFEDANIDYLNPSVEANRFGVVSIGFTATGPDMFASSAAIMGHTINDHFSTRTVWQDMQILRAGLGDYNPITASNSLGSYSATRLDPDDPFSFWTFQTFVNTRDRWSTRISETGVFDLDPTVYGDQLNNLFTFRAQENNSDWLAVDVDGKVTVFEKRAINLLSIAGEAGDDTFRIELGVDPVPVLGLTLRGGDGIDVIDTRFDTAGREFIVNEDGGGLIDRNVRFRLMETIYATNFDDTFVVDHTMTPMTFYGRFGDDVFQVNALTAQLNMNGQAGDDLFEVSLTQARNLIINGGAGFDNIRSVGTEFKDNIIIDNDAVRLQGQANGYVGTNVEVTSIAARAGADVISVRSASNQSELRLDGMAGDDVFIFSDTAPEELGNTDGITGRVTVEGGVGLNQLIVSNATNAGAADVLVTEDTIFGMTAIPISYVATGGFFRTDDFAGIKLIGRSGADDFVVRSLLALNNVRIEGQDGNDNFLVDPTVEGTVFLDGQNGSDNYNLVTLGTTDRDVWVGDTGLGEFDEINITLDESDNNFRYARGFLINNAERLITGFQTESVTINTLGGNDIVSIGNNNNSVIRVNTGAGDDSVRVDGSERGVRELIVNMADGTDTFTGVSGSKLTNTYVNLGEGDDGAIVQSGLQGGTRIDGANGSDSVVVNIASQPDRVVDVRDTGDTADSDTVTVIGTNVQDQMVLRPSYVSRSGELVRYDAGTERLNVETGSARDVISVLGVSPGVDSVSVRAQAGNDLFLVDATFGVDRLFLDGGESRDTFTVSHTTDDTNTTLLGQGGNDIFNIGSSERDADGNLSRINGRVNVEGGIGDGDWMYFSDQGGFAGYGYFIGNEVVTNLTSNVTPDRPEMASIFYDRGVERLRLDATQQENFVTVVPNRWTEIAAYGLAPTSSGDGPKDVLNVPGDSGDGRSIAAYGDGDGIISFTNGFQKIRYYSFETVLTSSSSSNAPLASFASSGNQGDGSNDQLDRQFSPLADGDLGLSGSQELTGDGETNEGNVSDFRTEGLDAFFAEGNDSLFI